RTTWRPAHRTAHQVRAGDQPQDRQGARPHDPAVAAAARGPGNRIVNRRGFLGAMVGGLFAAPLAADAQQAAKVWRIGYLDPGKAPVGWSQHGPGPAGAIVDRPFTQGMKDLGYVEGRDFVIEYRWAEGHPDRLPELAADLVRARVDIIVTG